MLDDYRDMGGLASVVRTEVEGMLVAGGWNRRESYCLSCRRHADSWPQPDRLLRGAAPRMGYDFPCVNVALRGSLGVAGGTSYFAD
jgi:hypothetical protein